jgi:predicted transcriptional regulator
MTLDDAFDDTTTSHTLLVTVCDDESVYEAGRNAIQQLESGDPVDAPDTFSFPDVETLFETFDSQTVELLETITAEQPASIRETARLVERDVKNVHEELTRLCRQGVIQFDEDGRSKRPVFPYRDLVISLPFAGDERTERVEVSG